MSLSEKESQLRNGVPEGALFCCYNLPTAWNRKKSNPVTPYKQGVCMVFGVTNSEIGHTPAFFQPHGHTESHTVFPLFPRKRGSAEQPHLLQNPLKVPIYKGL